MLPVSGWLNPARRRTNDVFPAPDFPIIATFSPLDTLRESCSKSGCPPSDNLRVTLLTESAVWPSESRLIPL